LDPAGEPLLHPEVEFHTYPSSPEAGVYRGRDAVLAYNQLLFEQFESTRMELEELLPAGDRVMVVSRQHAVPKAGGEAMVVRVIEVWAIRDDMLAERDTFSTREEALEAVGPAEVGRSLDREAKRRWKAQFLSEQPTSGPTSPEYSSLRPQGL
jgi:ketosteroid isomerase-like protein